MAAGLVLSGYQIEAVDRCLENETFGVFDPPGAGKTATAISTLQRYDQWPVLITVPAHLVLQWKLQLELWGVPSEQIAYTPRGTQKAKRIDQLVSDRPYNIVSYEMWSQEHYRNFFLSPHWEAYVCDESHRLRKGVKGKGGAWRGIGWLRTKTRSKHMHTPLWLLSGTPIVKDATDVWPLLHLANPYRFSSRQDFAFQMCRTSRTPYGIHVGPVRDPEAFHALLGRHSIRRSWREIPELRGLKKRDVQFPVELSPAEIARHRTIKRDYRDPVTGEPVYSSSAMIHTLRRLTISAKVEAFKEIVEDSPPHRWLAVAWYRDSAKMTYDRVRAIHPHTVYIDGGTPEKERQIALRRYQDYSDTILVGTLAALETGLNLQAGYNFAFLEQHYLSTTNEQAVARLLRRGQTQPVLVYNLYCPKTFDVRVRAVSERRALDIERALDEFLSDEEWNE